MQLKLHHKLCFLAIILALIICLVGCNQAGATSTDPDADTNTATGDISSSTPPAENSNDADDAPAEFLTEVKARFLETDDPTWQTELQATNGETLEFQIQYANLDAITHDDVNISVDLGESLTYIEGSTKLYNTKYPNGAQVDQDDIITDKGIYLGSYIGRQEGEEQGANLYVRFSASVNHDARPGSQRIAVFVHARRADQTDPTSNTENFYITTPLASMP